MNEQPTVEIAFFPDFEDETIVFAGSAEALLGFSQFLAELPDLLEDVDDAVPIQMFPILQPLGNANIFIRLGADASGMRQIADNTFEWGLSRESVLQFAEQVGAIAEAPGPSHQFLNSYSSDEVVVMVSKGIHNLHAMLREAD